VKPTVRARITSTSPGSQLIMGARTLEVRLVERPAQSAPTPADHRDGLQRRLIVMPHPLTRTLPLLLVIVALCAVTAPALAGSSARDPIGGTAGGGEDSAAVTVSFTVRPVIVLVVDDSGAPTQLWTNIPGSPTAAELDGVEARLGTPRGTPVGIGPSLRAQLPAILAGAGWGHQGLIWQRS
jgi:hypothetical protein